MKSFRIIENVYRKHVTVCIEPDRKKAEAWIKSRADADKDLSRCLGTTLYPNKPGKDLLVWLRRGDDITTLAHEFLHCATWILQTAGVPISCENDEPIAYLQEFLLASALQRLGHRRLVGSAR